MTDITRKQALVYLFVASLFVILPRMDFQADISYNVDEATTAMFGEVVRQGGVPYKDVMDARPPLTHLVYTLIFSVSGGPSFKALHAFLLFLVVLNAWVLYGVVSFLHSRRAGALTALIFSIVSFNHFGWCILTFHTEWLTILFLSGAFWALFKGFEAKRVRWAFLSGTFFGLAVFAKQQAALVFLGVILYLAYLVQKKRESGRLLIFLGGGFAMIVSIFLLALAAVGALKDFWFDVWVWSAGYSSIIPLSLRISRAYTYLFSPRSIFYHNAVFFLAALTYLFSPHLRSAAWINGRDPGRTRSSLFLIVWLVCAYIGSSMSGRSFGYYYILTLPPLCILAAIVFSYLADRAQLVPFCLNRGCRFVVIFALIAALYPVINLYSGLKKEKIDWTSFPWLVKPPAVYEYERVEENTAFKAMVSYVKSASAPADKIFVWGFLPNVYLRAGRMPASKHFYSQQLTGFMSLWGIVPDRDPFAHIVPHAWEELAVDLEKNKPRFIVDTTPGAWSGCGNAYAPEKYEKMKKILGSEYQLDRVFHSDGADSFKVYRRGQKEKRPGIAMLTGLIGFWRFDDDARDDSLFGHDSILYGTRVVEGRKDTALEFDGSHDFVDLGKGFADWPKGLTFACWAYPTAVKSWARFLELGNGTPEDNIIFAREGTSNDLVFAVNRGGFSAGGVVARDAIRLNEWQHFAVTLSPQGVTTIYKNGTPIQLGQTAPPVPVIRRHNYIGKSGWRQDEYYAGRIDEVYLFNRELNLSEIIELLNN